MEHKFSQEPIEDYVSFPQFFNIDKTMTVEDFVAKKFVFSGEQAKVTPTSEVWKAF
jgi:hypothetical protein